jgi:hypothetical protein
MNMKTKNLILTLFLSAVTFAFADQTIQLDDPNVSLTCGKYEITKNSTAKEIRRHCHVVDYKTSGIFRKHETLKLLTTDGTYVKCRVINDKLNKCKIVD